MFDEKNLSKEKEILYQEDLGCDPGATEKWRCGRQISKKIFSRILARQRGVLRKPQNTLVLQTSSKIIIKPAWRF